MAQNLNEQKDLPSVYMPLGQFPVAFMSVVMRVKGNPSSFHRMAASAVLEVNPGIPIYNVMTMEEVLLYSVWEKQFFAHLLLWIADIALLLAAMGLYGVMAFNVTQRTREIGIRMALGAPKSNVLLLVVGQGARLVIVGVAIGITTALILVRLVPGELFGVEPVDPPTIILVSGILIAVALIASYLPARKAARVDPMEALRYE